MHISETPEYRKAFIHYLRRGTPIALSLKAETEEHPTPQYIWRTQGDNKVRPSHAANNGKIFSWDNPPSTGNPGEDYNCRCTAEPYVRGQSEFAEQTLLPTAQDYYPQWDTIDFIRHFYFGGSRPVTLHEIGHLSGVINYYYFTVKKEGNIIYDRVNSQIIDAAKNHGPGSFSYDFRGSYDFSALYVCIWPQQG